jgi:hypothetical protein
LQSTHLARDRGQKHAGFGLREGASANLAEADRARMQLCALRTPFGDPWDNGGTPLPRRVRGQVHVAVRRAMRMRSKAGRAWRVQSLTHSLTSTY